MSKDRQPPGDSWASSPATRASMRSNRGRDTSPEMVVRRNLHAQGYRYRVSTRPLPELRRTADIVFTRTKVAVFIDGCFWHGCPQDYQQPAAHADFWASKKARNVERDRETDAILMAAGWHVLRFWEHEVRADAGAVTDAIACAVDAAGGQAPA